MNTRQLKVNKLKLAAIVVALSLLRSIYSVIKLVPSGELITVLSRQCDDPTDDIRLLEAQLISRGLKYKILSRRIPSSITGRVRYLAHILRQLVALTRSRVLVVDGYSIVASALNHKSHLRIIQIWHGSGAFKRFGNSAIGSVNGPNPDLARIFRLHANYDFALCSGPKAAQPFSEAFGMDLSRVLEYPLPHFDLLNELNRIEISSRIYQQFADLRGKQVVIWAPTRSLVGGMNRPSRTSLVSASENFGLKIITSTEKCHLEKSSLTSNEFAKFSTLDLMSISIGLVTDQSSMIFEAMSAGLPFVIYIASGQRQEFDKASFLNSNTWGDFITDDAEKAISMITSKEYIAKCLSLRKDYIASPRGHSYSEDLADLIELVKSGVGV